MAVAAAKARYHMEPMSPQARSRRLTNQPIIQWLMFALGVALILLSPLVGAIPGPGGIIVAAIGLALVLRTSMWAKRNYVRFKRWKPKAGRWMDRALGRANRVRREAVRKAARSASGN